jgi:hypothetical protein
MLKEQNNNPIVGDIVTVKLVSGEEIVGKLADKSIDSIYISRPVQVAMQQVNANQVGLAFLPVLGSINDSTTIQIPFSGMTIRPVKTNDEVKRNYIQATTNIITPSQEQRAILMP